jgi:hypothetical protein
MRYLAPAWFERIARFEDSFGRTIQRSCGIRHLADRGRPYSALIEQPGLARRALAHAWRRRGGVRRGAWQGRGGAFALGPGPC